MDEKITKDTTSIYDTHITHIQKEDWMELYDMIEWIGENATSNGRVHFEFKGGVLDPNNGGIWSTVKIKFTNDTENAANKKNRTARVDEMAFKLRFAE